MEEKEKTYKPIINGLQKMALYTTRSRCYLIGCNNTQKKFRVLKIDRTEPHDLVLIDDNVEYSQSEIKELLMMIGEGNKISSNLTSQTVGVTRTISAFGILGFIRFMEGYYLILITKRRKVAVIGYHSIFKVEDTSVIYMPHESVRQTHDDEQKYVRLLNTIDFTSNFYFSYTYDLTNSLQHNIAAAKTATSEIREKETFMNFSDVFDERIEESEKDHYGIWNLPHEKFVWNSFLLKPLKNSVVHPCWLLPVMHGFIAQSNISVYGRSFYLTLIARRSTAYAGPRFLKRGANCEGDVANEVETEQIVHDAHVSSFKHGKYTSFVQVRGSIPCHWSQDVTKIVPKPPISIDTVDPYAQTAGRHFNKLFKRFGSPQIVLNLVKKREKKPHESILNEEFKRLINQLNFTLPVHRKIQHYSIDMARITKNKKENVMNRLAEIAFRSIVKTGIFQTRPSNSNLSYDKAFAFRQRMTLDGEGRQIQTGVVRVNCVDCLDRTNTAQFSLGKCALAFQLYCLGVIPEPALEFDTACVRLLEEIFEDHGDTLALQYGGSQLVHRIATYRKTAPWSSHGNDIMQSLSRYLSNTFTDQEKQQAMNLLLGVFEPLKQKQPIWNLTSDYLLHHKLSRNKKTCRKISANHWWNDEMMDTLPLSYDQVYKNAKFIIPMHRNDPRIDLFWEHYRPFEYSSLADAFSFHMNNSASFFQNDSNQIISNESPFRVRENRSQKSKLEQNYKKTDQAEQKKKFRLFYNSSSTLNSDDNSDQSSSDSWTMVGASDDEASHTNEVETDIDGSQNSNQTKNDKSIFQEDESRYGTIIKPISERDMQIYERYAKTAQQISPSSIKKQVSKDFIQFEASPDVYTNNSHTVVVSERSIKIYEEYVALKKKGYTTPKDEDILKYKFFATKSSPALMSH